MRRGESPNTRLRKLQKAEWEHNKKASEMKEGTIRYTVGPN